DEADQMLDLGFLKPIRQIIGRLPKARQTLLFSATMPDQIARLAKDFLRNPERVSVAPVSSTAERVNQRVVHIDAPQKRHLLAKLFAEQDMSRTLVFTRTKHGADRLAKHLRVQGVSVSAIHGNKSQSQRERALEAFRDARIQVLVATDIAARGIDIDDVTHVVNYELPEVPEAYVHRIGRTARAGASGSAISFCDDGELKYLRGIERLTRQKIPSETYRNGAAVPDRAATGYDPVATADAEREARSKRGGRPSRKRGSSNRSPKAAVKAAPTEASGGGGRTKNKAEPQRGKANENGHENGHQGSRGKSRKPNSGRNQQASNDNSPSPNRRRNRRGNGPRRAAV
ncbi:MAG: DEAD/DEAH box helicase, partial [Hyphomicrobiaceae bacterium]